MGLKKPLVKLRRVESLHNFIGVRVLMIPKHLNDSKISTQAITLFGIGSHPEMNNILGSHTNV